MYFHFTYITVDLESEKYYVGRHSTKNLFDKYMGSGNWIKKYPKDKKHRLHTYVLEFFENTPTLKTAEQKLLDKYIGSEGCMNFSNKSTGFATGEKNPKNLLTEEQRKYQSDNHWTKKEAGSKGYLPSQMTIEIN